MYIQNQNKEIAQSLLANLKAIMTICKVRINATNKKKGEIFIGFNTPNADLHLTETGDLIEAAAKLFDLLHVADKMNPISIAVAPIPNIGIGEAINERLARAAAPRN